MAALEACLLGGWAHSHEEDSTDLRVYRRFGYAFPPARGRTAYEFRDGGELVYYGIARGDGPQESGGRWSIDGPNRVRIEVAEARIAPVTWEVVSCDADTLTVKR